MACQVVRISLKNKVSVSGNQDNIALLGNFDGLHLGHRQLISNALALSGNQNQQNSNVLIRFYPHPRQVLSGKPHFRILSLESELETLSELGISQLALVRFSNSMSQLSARNFFQEILVNRCRIKHLIVGPDARIGHNRTGDLAVIKELGSEFNVEIIVADWKELNGQRVSSSEIRRLLDYGLVAEAAQLLGQRYKLSGCVVHGDRRGSSIGFPTANIQLNKKIIPKNGVYLGTARLNGTDYPAICNIGSRPTFTDNSKISFEVHIPDYTGPDFYGCKLSFEFSARLRDEQRFNSVAELVAQITADIARLRDI